VVGVLLKNGEALLEWALDALEGGSVERCLVANCARLLVAAGENTAEERSSGLDGHAGLERRSDEGEDGDGDNGGVGE